MEITRQLEHKFLRQIQQNLNRIPREVNDPRDVEELAHMSRRLTLQLHASLSSLVGPENIVYVPFISGERSDTSHHISSALPFSQREGIFINMDGYYSEGERLVVNHIQNHQGTPVAIFESSEPPTAFELSNMFWWKKPSAGESMGTFDEYHFNEISQRLKGRPTKKAMKYIHEKYHDKQIVLVRGDMRSSPERGGTPIVQTNMHGDIIFYPKAPHWTTQLSEEYSDKHGLPYNLLHFDPTKGGDGKECVQISHLRGA